MSGPPDDLLRRAREILPWIVDIRRDLHAHPELSEQEHRTMARVVARLEELGIEHRTGVGETGALAWLRGTGRGQGDRAVALRADMDALPIHEANDVPYRSRNDGVMHACGHDVHTAVLLGAARLLAEQKEELAGTVTLLFQPAEETVGGAQRLIEAGALDDPPIDKIFGLHVDPSLAVGRIGLHYGQRSASSDTLRITIRGRSGHGAYPAGSVDAVVAASHVVTALQAIVSRNVDARRTAVVSIGTFHGGTQHNIVADRVEMTGTVRTLEPVVRETVLARVRETVEGVARGLGATVELEIEAGYPPLINNDAAVDLVRSSAAGMLGEEAITVYDRPMMGVEDFAYYVERKPGAFYSLGVRNEERGIVHSVHHERFDVDEECLAIGAALQARNALAALGG